MTLQAKPTQAQTSIHSGKPASPSELRKCSVLWHHVHHRQYHSILHACTIHTAVLLGLDGFMYRCEPIFPQHSL